MNYQEMTFSAMVAALRRHWKAWLLTAAVFALVGCAAALFLTGTDAAAAGEAEKLEGVDLEELEEDSGYYQAWLQAMQKKYNETETYIASMQADSTATKEQIKALTVFYRKKVAKFQKEQLIPLQKTLAREDVLLVPERFLPQMEEELEESLLENEKGLQISQSAAELLKSMEAPRIDNESVSASYAKLLSQAAALGEYQVGAASCREKLDRLQNNLQEVLTESRDFQRELDAAMQAQNALLKELNQFASEFARENHVNLLQDQDEDGKLKVVLEHTHGADSRSQRAVVLLVFCVLVGICAGAFFAVCMDVRQRKKQRSK